MRKPTRKEIYASDGNRETNFVILKQYEHVFVWHKKNLIPISQNDNSSA